MSEMNLKPGVWYLTMPSEMADKHERFWEEEIERGKHRQEIARRMGFDSREDVEKAIRRLKRDQQDKRKRH